MKLILPAFFAFFLPFISAAQSTLPKEVTLSLSTPQPRMGETFTVSLDLEELKNPLFSALSATVREVDPTAGMADNAKLSMPVTALQMGKQVIGPLEFTVNNIRYTTNRIHYEVIGALPDTDQGLWFRKVITGENRFCLIIEQRIPAREVTTRNADQSITTSTETDGTEMVALTDAHAIEGLNCSYSHSATHFSSTTTGKPERKFMAGIALYYFQISNNASKITLTAEQFDHLPPGYRFQPIVIQ